jgi:cell division septation protein DedD
MGLERDLHQLLHCHDCVIVPRWGGFLSHYRGARIDEARKLVHPPGKDLSFNRHLVRNDGLLADRLAKREGIGFAAANARIDAEVEGWRTALDRNGRLELPHIGIFYRDTEHNLQFDPDKRSNFLKDAYGLRPVTAIPVERVEPAPVVRELPKPVPAEVPAADGEQRVPMLWAAAATAAVLFGGAALWAYQAGGTQSGRWSGFDPFGMRVERTYVATAEELAPIERPVQFALPEGLLGVTSLPLPGAEGHTIVVDLGSPIPEAAAPESTAVAAPKAVASSKRARFHIIGGCFAQPENADKLLSELLSAGHPAVKLPKYGDLHPVAFGSYTTRSQALEALAVIRKDTTNAAWLLVR